MTIQPWLDGFAHVQLGPSTGRPYDETSRPKVCLHMTQGNSIEGAESAMWNYPPHLACEYEGRKRHQYLPLDRCSFSLAGSESDDEFLIQVEIVGFSENAPEFWAEELDWIGAEVLAPIWRAGVQFELVAVPQGFHGGDEGIYPWLASRQSPIRFANEAELRAFSGVMGHQHAPSPDSHWDPGRLDVDRILRACAAALSGTAPAPAPEPVPTPPPQPAPVPAQPSGVDVNVPILDVGANGPQVVTLQALLNAKSSSDPRWFPLALDGDFGGKTRAAADDFQQHYLGSKGAVGPRTFQALMDV